MERGKAASVAVGSRVAVGVQFPALDPPCSQTFDSRGNFMQMCAHLFNFHCGFNVLLSQARL